MFLLSNVAVPDTVNRSPATRSSRYVTDAAVVASYTLFEAEIVTASGRIVMFAVLLAVVFGV